MTTNPEYLIGDYASQTLSEGERRQLFEAALQDQTLFDRLVEEERWRQLFSLPDVQRELRTALVEPPSVAASSSPGIFAGFSRFLERQRVEGLGRPVAPLAMGTVAALLLVVVLLPRYAERGPSPLSSPSHCTR